jgi:hypothetical protein
MEPVADNTGHRLILLLIGVNCGCLLTLWGALATLLWRDRCHAAGSGSAGRDSSGTAPYWCRWCCSPA